MNFRPLWERAIICHSIFSAKIRAQIGPNGARTLALQIDTRALVAFTVFAMELSLSQEKFRDFFGRKREKNYAETGVF